MKTELTKEQSKHLIDLGVPKYKASNRMITTTTNECWNQFILTDLLEILPKEIELKDVVYRLHIRWNKLAQMWCAIYVDNSKLMKPIIDNHGVSSRLEIELIDALYQLLIYVIKRDDFK